MGADGGVDKTQIGNGDFFADGSDVLVYVIAYWDPAIDSFVLFLALPLLFDGVWVDSIDRVLAGLLAAHFPI